MAFGKLSDEGDDQPLSEINMIPMIDVMLVLLIVFMITAPLLTNAVKLELPEASSQLNQPDKQDINLAIDGAGKIYWNDQQVDEAALVRLMDGVDAVVNLVGVLHSDPALPYGPAFKRAHVDLPQIIVSACKKAGVRRLVHMSALKAAADYLRFFPSHNSQLPPLREARLPASSRAIAETG